MRSFDFPCGHPRTEENSKPVYSGGVRCRACQREWERECQKKRRAAKKVLDASGDHG